ncbi:restriction endonuclease [Siminovitchia fortis]|uniref:restriction endonuclease n=1 Tax=Siminovitchia fortis TaxID=254758 RepID=UPI001FD43DC4|nr:restriction endonuclease [Siminovitchia fortis]
MRKKKTMFEEIIFPGFVLLGLWTYFKTSSLSKSLMALFGLLFLYAITLIIKQFFHQKKLLKSGIQQIDEMTGRQFEEYLSELLRRQGYKVRLTKSTGDFGADLVLTSTGGKVIVVQAKRYKNNVGIKAVQEVGTSMLHYNAAEAWVITNSYYTKAARTLAKSNGVHLYNRDDLIGWILTGKKVS